MLCGRCLPRTTQRTQRKDKLGPLNESCWYLEHALPAHSRLQVSNGSIFAICRFEVADCSCKNLHICSPSLGVLLPTFLRSWNSCIFVLYDLIETDWSWQKLAKIWWKLIKVVIFFSLTEAPLTDPTATPPNTPEMDPKRTRNRPKTEPNGAKRSRTEPNGAKRSQTEPKWTEIKPSRVGWAGGLSGWGGVGVVREKEDH